MNIKSTVDLIEDVLQGRLQHVELKKLPIGKIIDYITETTGLSHDFESNGYQCDFWVYFREQGCDKVVFILSGDLWYAKYHTFEVGG